MKLLLPLLSLGLSLAAQAAVTIGTYNIRNFDYDERYHIRTDKVELASVLKSMNADVLAVQEINNTKEFQVFITKSMPGYAARISDCGGQHGQNLGFVYNSTTVDLLSFNEDLRIAEPGNQGGCNTGSRPAAIGLFQVKATGLRFFGLSLHLKSGNDAGSLSKRQKQYEIIKNLIGELRSKTGVKDFFFAGDLNTTEYRNRGLDFKNLTRVVESMGMVDLAANLPCSAYWWGGSDDGIETPTLLDHIVVTKTLRRNQQGALMGGHCNKVNCQEVPVRNLGTHYASVSDHCPLVAPLK